MRLKARAITCWKVKLSEDKDYEAFKSKTYKILQNFNINEDCLEKIPFENGLKRAIGFNILSFTMGLRYDSARISTLLRWFQTGMRPFRFS